LHILLIAVAPLCGLGLLVNASRGTSPPPPEDEAVARTRAAAKMLDDLFKVTVVDITNRYEGPPAAKTAKAVFAAAKEKGYFEARLLDVTGNPMNESNVPKDEFEKRAADAIRAGKTYVEEIIGEGANRRFRAATVVPAVVKRCADCHGVKEGELLGFLSYDLPVK
jgi:hypothetical protein